MKVLDEMEWHGVQPDKEIHDIVVNAFGEWNFATKKVCLLSLAIGSVSD